MIERFLDSLKFSCHVPEGCSVLLAVSGGSDSMAMLHLFHKARLRFEVAHLNHGIRGAEADDDAKFVQDECERLNVPFRLFRFDVPKFVAHKKLSLEEGGRRIRRHFFFRYARVRGLDYIAFAHTADDQVETVLLNFIRGAGPAGLTGISPKRGNIVHPLLPFSKLELRAFLKQNQIAYREDSTNEELYHARNRMRLDVIPFLENQTGTNLKENVFRAAEIFRAEEEWLRELVSPLFQERFRQRGNGIFELKLSSKEFPVALQRRLIRKFLESSLGDLNGIGFSHVEQIRALLSKQTGRRFEFSSHFAEKTREGLSLFVKMNAFCV